MIGIAIAEVVGILVGGLFAAGLRGDAIIARGGDFIVRVKVIIAVITKPTIKTTCVTGFSKQNLHYWSSDNQ